MHSDSLKSLLSEAGQLEKKYKWFQAAKVYKDASSLALEKREVLKAAELLEKEAYSFYRAAFQAKSNAEFRDTMELGVQAYQKESELLKATSEEKNQTSINNAEAMVAYLQCWIETAPAKKKQLTTKWWSLESQVLQAYEQAGDTHSAGRTCNNLIEHGSYDRIALVSSFSERLAIYKECTALAEKAIKVFQRLDDEYELAKAYCFASWYYTHSRVLLDSEEKTRQLLERIKEYSSRAFELAQKIGDAWLIGWSNFNRVWFLNFGEVNPDRRIVFELAEKTLEYSRTAEDNHLVGNGKLWMAVSTWYLALKEEDPDKQKDNFRKAKRLSQEAERYNEIVNFTPGWYASLHFHTDALKNLAKIEPDLKTKQALLERAIDLIQKGRAHLQGWELFYDRLLVVSQESLWLLAETKSETKEKRQLLLKAQSSIKKSIAYLEKMDRYTYIFFAENYQHLAMVQKKLAKTEANSTAKLTLLDQATASMEKGLRIGERKKKLQSHFESRIIGVCYQTLGGIQTQVFSITGDEQNLCKAIDAYRQSSVSFEKAEKPTHAAESYWHAAQLYDQTEKQQEASKNYESASNAYEIASAKIPQLKQFYTNYSLYMLAWSQIEQARYSHSLENYDKAKEHYITAAKNHKASQFWSYLSPNYFAWANMEEAEGLSRKENVQQSKKAFQKAYEQFTIAEESIRQKLETMPSDEKEMPLILLKASDLRRKYCQARILVEDAKLLDREGKCLQSSKSYAEAAKNISTIIEKTEVEAERKELEYLAVLCQAWEKMAVAEERASSEAYLEAAEFFDRARDYCYTKKANLWALGNSSFCKGLAAGIEYQITTSLSDNALAKRHIKNAASNYLQAGLKKAAEYAKATLRLFDAYVFMNQAESEVNPEKKTRQYQMAEKLLRIASGSFAKAQQHEKTVQIKQILETVKEEKALASSLAKVMQAPTIASSTSSFTAPTPSSEASVGLEQFQHANVQANIVATSKEVKVGESFCLTIDFVNAGREPALLTRVEDFIPTDFVVVEKPEICRLEDSCLNMKGKQIAPLKLVEAKLVLQPLKKGVYQVEPKIHYLNEAGQAKSLKLKSVEIKVEEVILANRVSTGTKELDMLLLGGIPKEYAVVLTGPPSDERELIIRNFLLVGEGQTSFYVATEAAGLENLLQKPNFHLFLCNPRPKVKVPELPNVYKLHGKADINNLNIALIQAYRTVEKSSSKRICINIVSDVLVNYGVKTTRKWITELTTDLVSKGFTVLAVVNPLVHTSEDLNSLLELFDGEISIIQTGDPLERKKALIVKTLRNQDFIKNPICLTKHG